MSALTTHFPEHLLFRDQADAREFGTLPDECRTDIRAKHGAIRRCVLAKHARGAGKLWEAEAQKLAGNRTGAISGKRLQNMATEYLRSAVDGMPDWRVLWNTSRWHRSDVRFTQLPAAFIQDWKRRVLAELPADGKGSRLSVGGMKTAHKRLLAEYRRARTDKTHPFPGYAITPPPAPDAKIPAGWSYSNLTRKENCPSEAERVSMRRGTGFARSLMPQVLSTRANTLSMQRVEMDDFEPDYEIIDGGERCKPLVLSALDYGTGCNIHHVAKPTWKRDDGATDKWKLAHIPLFVAALLMRCPFDQANGTQLVDEGGTMKIGDDLREILATASAGRIRVAGENDKGEVERPNRQRLGQIAGFQGGAVGNSNRKARIENWHLQLRNQLGTLPGYTGSNYTQKPEYLAGMQVETDRLLKLSLTLPPERAELIQHHLISFARFTECLAVEIGNVNDREDHDLEGWTRHTLDCIADEAGAFHPLDDLQLMPLETQALLIRAVELDAKRFHGQHRLSPAAAYRRETQAGLASGRLRMLSPWDCAEIIALAGKSEPDLRTIRPREVRAAYIVVQDTIVARLAEPIFYKARIAMPDGTSRELRNGEEVECVFNPFAPDVLFIRSEQGRFLGVAPRAERIDPNDRAATLAAYGEARSRRAERLAEVRKVVAPDIAAIENRRRHNARVVDLETPFLPDEIRNNAALREAQARVAEQLRISRQNTTAQTETY